MKESIGLGLRGEPKPTSSQERGGDLNVDSLLKKVASLLARLGLESQLGNTPGLLHEKESAVNLMIRELTEAERISPEHREELAAMREQLIEVRDRLTGPDSSIVAPSTIRSAYEAEGPDSIEELVKKAALFVLEHQAGIGGKMSEDKIESAREILSALEAYRDAHLEEKTSIRFVTSDHDILNFVEDSIRGLQRALSEQGAALQ